jgi:hypothetical protein
VLLYYTLKYLIPYSNYAQGDLIEYSTGTYSGISKTTILFDLNEKNSYFMSPSGYD